jgi:hypothetical protein
MSGAGPYLLQLNDGKQEVIISNMKKLGELIGKIDKRLTMQDPENENYVTPTLIELSKYCFIPVFKTYKPFVQITNEYRVSARKNGSMAFGGTLSFPIENCGQFISDCYLHVRLSSFSAISASDRVRWTAFPGHRLLEWVDFKQDGVLLDKVYSEDFNRYYQFNVSADKKIAWQRAVGQQVAYTGSLIMEPTTDDFACVRQYTIGQQTLKNTQPAFDMFIPQIFWFKDTANAYPIGNMRLDSTVMTFKFTDVANMVSLANNSGTGDYSALPKIEVAELITNHLYVPEEVIDIYLGRSFIQIVRIHQHFTKQLTNSFGNIWMNDFKFPVETIYFGFRPKANLTNSQLWHRMSAQSLYQVEEAVVTSVGTPHTITTNYGKFYMETNTIDEVGFDSNGVSIYPRMKPEFWSNATHFKSGNKDLVSSDDPGWFVVGFNNSAGSQPSGHINLSQGREFYINYKSSYISNTNVTTLLAFAQAIGFMTYSDGAATLREIT